MDPNACLAEMLELQAQRDRPEGLDRSDEARFGELFESMHEWISNGGFLPDAWQAKRKS